MAGMIVQHNMNALNAYNRLNTNVNGLKKSSEKLSSGYRINRAGDDAAGLAISEKMRSQIRGLNQAKRNSQDGISMIQTFEGALQETHSILQRMKELATESANGTYDNATDRAAIQLEFDQLNDELNQIADTDFNGVVVLNGGEMADGLKANADNEFDYSELAAQKKAAALAEPADLLSANNLDTGKAIFNTVDEKAYDLDAAKQLWTDLGLDKDTEAVNLTVKVTGVDKTTGAVTYEALEAKTTAGKAVDATKFTIAPKNGNGTTISGHGGFTVTAGGADVNTILDGTGVKEGDLITLQFTGPGAGNKAPANAGVANDSITTSSDKITVGTDPSVTIGALTDDEMTESLAAALEKLDGATVVADIPANNNNAAPTTFEVKDADGNVLFDETAAGNAIDITGNGDKVWVAFTGGKITLSALNAAGNGAGTKIADIDLGKYTEAAGTAGTAEFKIAFDEYFAAPADQAPDVEAIATESLADKVDTSVSNSNNYENSTAILTYKEDITLQVGARSKDAVNFTFNYNKADMGDLKANLDVSARADGLNTANLKLDNQDDANYAIDQIDKAINKVSMVRATFGAMQNRLEHKIENITTTSENLTEAEASIRDTDMASEMMNYTKYNILQQAAQSMLAQANQQPQSILQLLG